MLTYAFSWGAWLPLLLQRISFASHLWKMAYVAGLSGPLVASTLVSFASGGGRQVKLLGKRGLVWKVAPIWYGVALALPPVLMLGGWVIAKMFGETHWRWEMPSLGLLPLTLLVMGIRGGPLNEEFGWRGFLLPYFLESHSPFFSTLMLAPIWTLWHVPLWFLPGVPHKYWPFGLFALLLLPVTFLFTWLHLRTRGSVLIAILLHTAFNTAIHYLPLLPPRHPSLVPFQMWVAVSWVVAMAVVFWNYRLWFARPVTRDQAKSANHLKWPSCPRGGKREVAS